MYRTLDAVPKLLMGLVLVAGLAFGAWAQDPGHVGPIRRRDGTSEVTSRSKGTLSDCTHRAFVKAWVETDDSGVLDRFTTVVTTDDSGVSATLSLAEYSGGNVGLHLGSRDDKAKDQWIVLQKEVIKVVKESVSR